MLSRSITDLQKFKQQRNKVNNMKKFAKDNYNQRTNGPVNAHLSLLHIPINMFEYYGI